jgi:hypothetical protein
MLISFRTIISFTISSDLYSPCNGSICSSERNSCPSFQYSTVHLTWDFIISLATQCLLSCWRVEEISGTWWHERHKTRSWLVQNVGLGNTHKSTFNLEHNKQFLEVPGFTSFYHHKENISLSILNVHHLFFSWVFDVQSFVSLSHTDTSHLHYGSLWHEFRFR